MATTKGKSKISSPLGNDDRKTTGEALQGALIDLVELSLQAKQVHWNLVGKRFRSIHLELDEVVATAREFTDTVAERAVTIGVNPDGRVQTVAKESEVPPLDPGYISDGDAIADVTDRLGGIIGRMRERIGATEKPDPVTQDLLIDVSAALEKHHWMFQAQR